MISSLLQVHFTGTILEKKKKCFFFLLWMIRRQRRETTLEVVTEQLQQDGRLTEVTQDINQVIKSRYLCHLADFGRATKSHAAPHKPVKQGFVGRLLERSPGPTPGQDQPCVSLSGQAVVQPILGALGGGEAQPALPLLVSSPPRNIPCPRASA